MKNPTNMFGSVNFPLSGSVVFRFSDLPYLILHHLDGLRSRGHRQLLGHVSTKRYVETPHLCCLMMFYMCICWCLHSYVTRCTVIFNYIYNRLIYYVYQSESPIHIDSTHSCAIKFNTPTFVAWLPDILKIHHDLSAPGKCKVPIAGWLKIGMPKNGICVSQKKNWSMPKWLGAEKEASPKMAMFIETTMKHPEKNQRKNVLFPMFDANPNRCVSGNGVYLQIIPNLSLHHQFPTSDDFGW